MKITRTQLLCSLLPLTAMVIGGITWAQGTDTPIIISDGSLTMESRGVPWSQWGTGGTRHHPNATKSITAVDLAVNGTTRTITFNGQPCTVTAQYGGTTITISTDGGGKNLQLATDFSAFHPGSTQNVLAHNDPNNHIGAVSVRRGGQTAFSGTGNGGTVITIHYR